MTSFGDHMANMGCAPRAKRPDLTICILFHREQSRRMQRQHRAVGGLPSPATSARRTREPEGPISGFEALARCVGCPSVWLQYRASLSGRSRWPSRNPATWLVPCVHYLGAVKTVGWKDMPLPPGIMWGKKKDPRHFWAIACARFTRGRPFIPPARPPKRPPTRPRSSSVAYIPC